MPEHRMVYSAGMQSRHTVRFPYTDLDSNGQVKINLIIPNGAFGILNKQGGDNSMFFLCGNLNNRIRPISKEKNSLEKKNTIKGLLFARDSEKRETLGKFECFYWIAFCKSTKGEKMDTEELLKNVKLFSGLSAKNLKRLGSRFKERPYKKGDTIVKQGETGVGLFVIVSGTVSIRKKTAGGDEFEVAVSGPGDFIGEMAVLDDAPRSASVIALEDTECLALVSWDFKALMKEHPEIALDILPIVVKRFRETNEKLLSMSSM